jgi:hypothetical protein
LFPECIEIGLDFECRGLDLVYSIHQVQPHSQQALCSSLFPKCIALDCVPTMHWDGPKYPRDTGIGLNSQDALGLTSFPGCTWLELSPRIQQSGNVGM